jgi:hypothetical protein
MADKVRRVDWSPDEWLSGTRGQLTITELAVYDVVLNTIYSRGGRAPNDAEFMFGHFKPMYRRNHHLTRKGEIAMIREALDQLLALGKLRLTADGQWLTNGRADVELGRAGERIVGAVRAGIASGVARRARRSGQTSPLPPHSLPTSSPGNASRSSNSNDLTRTSVRNHQPSYDHDVSTTETEAARATVRVSDALPAARPTTKLDPRLEAAAKAARAKLLNRGSS